MNILEVGNYAYVLLQSANVDTTDVVSINFKGKTYNYVPMTMDRIANIYLQTQGLVELSSFYKEPLSVSIPIIREAAKNAGLDEFEAESIDDIETSNYSYIINRVLMWVEMSKEITKTYLFAIDKLYNNWSDKEKSEIKSTFKNNLSESKNQYFKSAFNTLWEATRKDIIAQINKWWTLKFDYEKISYDLTYAVIDVWYWQKSNLEFIKTWKWWFVDFTSSVESVKKYSPDLYNFLKNWYEPIRIVADDISKQNEKSRKEYAQRMAKSIALEIELENSMKELNKKENTLKDKENTLKNWWIEIAKIFAANSN